MKRKLIFVLFVVTLLLIAAGSASANDLDDVDFYPWNHHIGPFDFKFGAMIDSHQQSKINGAGILKGFIYIHRTVEVTADGIPIAEKAHCSTGDCSVGWIIKGVPITARLVHLAPRTWLYVDGDLPSEGGYNHFQWLGPPKTPHELELGAEYDGYLLRRVAPEPFFWLGGGKGSSGGPSGGCDGHDGTDGGCDGHDGTSTEHTDGGCSGHTDTGGTDHSGGSPGDHGGGKGHIVEEGVDSHTNFVMVWDGPPTGDCDGCSGDDSGCDGH